MLTFKVDLGDGMFLGADGHPTDEASAFEFQLRPGTALDTLNTQRRVRELAEGLQSSGHADPMAYADMLAAHDMMRGSLKEDVRVALEPYLVDIPEQDRVISAAVECVSLRGAGLLAERLTQLQREKTALLTIQSLENVEGFNAGAKEETAALQLRATGKLDQAFHTTTIEIAAVTAMLHLPSEVVRRLFKTYIEVSHIGETLDTLDSLARWQILSTPMPDTHRQLDACPGWEAFGAFIVSAWQQEERKQMRGFRKPSST